MYDIYINGHLSAVCAEGLVKIFVNALVQSLGLEMDIKTTRHIEEPVVEASKASTKSK
jgi:hypothetical protein